MMDNHSSATEFHLLGFPGSQELHQILFAVFFFFYLVTLMGNTVIIVIVCSPMYFFLGHLSALEILITTIIVPMMLWGLLLPGMQTVSLSACIFALPGVMAVDHYVAVCNLLRYNIIMNSSTCIWVVIVSWVFGFLSEIWPVYFILFLMAVVILIGSLIPTIVSYTYIISTILKIPSASGQRKTFSTYASHFTCVVIGYGSCLFLYVKPKQTQGAEYNKIVSLLVSVLTPFLNPFIFTLRNDKVKEVLQDGAKRCCQLLKD
uniref:Olfactory receptor family 9 subfamily A member 2 n=1 Tax=Saimiri boliviensis boliviensis TaxID=39432 RepID=A0A2K6UXZ9_SAIBB